MKFNSYCLAVVVSTLFVGCDQNKSSPPPDTNAPAPPPNTNKVVDIGQTKEEFMARMDKRMQELDDKISDLAKKSEGYQADAKVQADKALAALREERDTVRQKLDDVKKASQEAWEEAKAKAVTAWHGLETAFDNAKAKFQ